MQMTDAERLSLLMLAEIHQATGIKNGTDAKLVHDAIWSGNEWAIYWDIQLPWSNSGKNPPHVTHVGDVFDMWDLIETSYAALSPANKATVDNATGSKNGPRFPGFDGNNESDEYSAALFMTHNMNRWGKFKGRALNSHHATVERSKRMIAVFEPIRASLGNRNPVLLTDQEIIAIATA